MSSAKTLAQKVKELIERISGCPYVMESDRGRLDWYIGHPPARNESEVENPCYAFADVHAREHSIEVESGYLNMMKVLEHSYNLWIRPEEYDRFLDPDVRKRLEKIIPAIVKDYDIVCNGIDEVTKKYGLPQGEFKLWDSDLMRFGAKFKADGMSDEELLKVIEQRFRAVSEVSFRFFSWLGFGTKFSPERQALLEKGVRVPGLPGRLRRSGFLVMDWPPNTGDPRKDEKIIADVKEHLERDWAEVFTPEGRLKLVNGEIVFVRPKRRKTTKP